MGVAAGVVIAIVAAGVAECASCFARCAWPMWRVGALSHTCSWLRESVPSVCGVCVSRIFPEMSVTLFQCIPEVQDVCALLTSDGLLPLLPLHSCCATTQYRRRVELCCIQGGCRADRSHATWRATQHACGRFAEGTHSVRHRGGAVAATEAGIDVDVDVAVGAYEHICGDRSGAGASLCWSGSASSWEARRHPTGRRCLRCTACGVMVSSWRECGRCVWRDSTEVSWPICCGEKRPCSMDAAAVGQRLCGPGRG